MTNLDSILKSRDMTLPAQVCLVKAMDFPGVTWGKERTVKSLSCVWLCDLMDHHLPGSSVRGIFQARVLEWLPFLLQGMFLTQGLNLGLPHCKQMLYRLSHQGGQWMWELDHKESWALRNWCFWTVMLEKTLESPLDCKEIQPVHPKGNQSWIFIGRTDAEAETFILWPPDVESWLIGKDPDVGIDWKWEEKGVTEHEMVGWHHRLNGDEFE